MESNEADIWHRGYQVVDYGEIEAALASVEQPDEVEEAHNKEVDIVERDVQDID